MGRTIIEASIRMRKIESVLRMSLLLLNTGSVNFLTVG
jgi:hypothetical protein